VRQEEVFGLTIPLLVDQHGNKFGKTMEKGEALWLDANKTSPYDFYQFLINIDDKEVEDLLKKATFIDLTIIEEIMNVHKEMPELRLAQKTLATNLCELIHGVALTEEAENKTNSLFSMSKKSLSEMTADEIEQLFENV